MESPGVRVPPDRRLPVAQWVSNVPLPEPHLIGIAAAIWLHRVRPLTLPGPRHVHQLVGWPLIAAGSYLVVRSVRATRQVSLAHPDRLVITGPYAISRNPMYVGWALLHLGAGVAGGSGWILAAFPAVTGLVHRQVLREERDLGEDFGDEFARYRAAAPRYLPGRRSSPMDVRCGKRLGLRRTKADGAVTNRVKGQIDEGDPSCVTVHFARSP